MVNTFANPLHGAHLTSIFHGMQAEVDFWNRLLLLESSQSIVYLVTIFHPRREGALLRRTVHDRDLEN